MTAAVSNLVETLARLGVLTPEQAAELTRDDAEQFTDAAALADELLARGWLTRLQAHAVRTGKIRGLAIGPFILLDKIGEGGMGTVYKARHRKLSRIVALKLIRKDRLSGEKAARRFEREVRAAAQLSHPNIVLAYDADQAGPVHYFAMEYVDGVDFSRLVRKQGPLPIDVACDAIRQAALGLQHAHERGLVHRDIKPSNLLLDRAGVVKLLDLGLALSGDDGKGSLTHEGVVLGTPDYVAPEQARNAHAADIRADLYSLGCTFYFLLTGRPPFVGGSVMERLVKHLMESPPPLRELRPEVPEWLAAVVDRLLAKRPEDRFQTPEELIAALRPAPVPDALTPTPFAFDFDFATETPAEGALPEVVPEVAPPAPKPLWYTPALIVVVGVGTLVLVAAGLLAFGGRTPEKKPEAAAPKKAKSSSPKLTYIRRGTRAETIVATLKANRLPAFDGPWRIIGPFDNRDGRGFETAYPPEKEFVPTKSYTGKDDRTVSWKLLNDFSPGRVFDLTGGKESEGPESCVYLSHEFRAESAVTMPVDFSSDDTLTVWFNGERLFSRGEAHAIDLTPEGLDRVELRVKAGENRLLIKVCNGLGDWLVYLCPEFPVALQKTFGIQLSQDFINERTD